MKKISCIIPCHNERDRIGRVLEVVVAHPLIDEIIVVDDGSEDNTKIVVQKYKGVKLAIHEKNRGKSSAICTGMRLAQGRYVLMIDADLIGLNSENITELLLPITSGMSDVSMSLRKNPWEMRLLGIDFLTGERVFLKKILEDHLSEIDSLPSFALEVYINKLIINNNLRITVVPWLNVEGPYRMKKYGFVSGWKMEFGMWWDILKTISLFDMISQIIELNKLKVVKKNNLKIPMGDENKI